MKIPNEDLDPDVSHLVIGSNNRPVHQNNNHFPHQSQSIHQNQFPHQSQSIHQNQFPHQSQSIHQNQIPHQNHFPHQSHSTSNSHDNIINQAHHPIAQPSSTQHIVQSVQQISSQIAKPNFGFFSVPSSVVDQRGQLSRKEITNHISTLILRKHRPLLDSLLLSSLLIQNTYLCVPFCLKLYLTDLVVLIFFQGKFIR